MEMDVSVCVCVGIYVLVNLDTHVETKRARGEKRTSKNPVSLPIPSEVIQSNQNKELMFDNYAPRLSNHQIQSQLAAGKSKQGITIFVPYKIQTPSGPLAAACWRRQQRSQNR